MLVTTFRDRFARERVYLAVQDDRNSVCPTAPYRVKIREYILVRFNEIDRGASLLVY